MVDRTARSVLAQDWPTARLMLVLGDDGRSRTVAAVAAALGAAPRGHHQLPPPPAAGGPARRGDAKAGNLNAAWRWWPATSRRSPSWRRETPTTRSATRASCASASGSSWPTSGLASCRPSRTPASARAIRSTTASRFYRGLMPARNATNAVFPCGSGLVWRRAALAAHRRFPDVESGGGLQSGVEALRRGWRSLYLPIVGAVAQHAPEDLPNVYKQRGTWALDTMRLLLWGDLRGLGLRQRLHFTELGLFYVLAASLPAFLLAPIAGLLWGIFPLRTDPLAYAVHLVPAVAAMELFLLAWRGRQPYTALWRARQLWLGLAPVYLWACLLALAGGPGRKPAYRVTRKRHRFGWHWRETIPHLAAMGLLAVALGVHFGALPEATTGASWPVDLGSADFGSAAWPPRSSWVWAASYPGAGSAAGGGGPTASTAPIPPVCPVRCSGPAPPGREHGSRGGAVVPLPFRQTAVRPARGRARLGRSTIMTRVELVSSSGWRGGRRRAVRRLLCGAGAVLAACASAPDGGAASRAGPPNSSPTRVTYAGREVGAPWRQAAAQRIERSRKADLTVLVRDSQGRALPDAAVAVTQRRHAFGFGTSRGRRRADGRRPGPGALPLDPPLALQPGGAGERPEVAPIGGPGAAPAGAGGGRLAPGPGPLPARPHAGLAGLAAPAGGRLRAARRSRRAAPARARAHLRHSRALGAAGSAGGLGRGQRARPAPRPAERARR